MIGMRRKKVYLEDLIDKAIGKLYKARALCCSPGDNYAIDLLLEVREISRRCVRVSRSRINNNKNMVDT